MSDRFHVGTRKGLFDVRRGGSGWRIERAAFLGDPVSALLPASHGGGLLVALDHGHFGSKLHRSMDGGETFEELAAPAYPAKPEDEEDLDAFSGEPREWKLQKIWALERGQDGVVWCGTLPGGLFRSTDDGASWDLVRGLWDHPDRKRWFGGGADVPGLHSVCIDPRDPARVLVAVSCGGAWLSTDGGESWTVRADGMRAEYLPPAQANDPVIQDPHILVQCPAAPDVLWTQHHNGIFRSTDGGEHWTEIEKAGPSTFGFAAAVHPRDPDTAWFIPAVKDERRIPADGRVVVTRTRDGGKSFDVLREGLPQEHAYDLVYRHALDIDGSGERLAFGSTTGSLWVSEDGGDSWTTVSNHLPPVYCLRFGS